MSGGAFNYLDSQLRNQIFGYGPRWNNALEDLEISELTWDLLDLLHEYDWYSSGDTGEERYLKAKQDFKAKWFGDRSARIKHVVDSALDDLRAELYKTYGLPKEEKEEEHVG